jgi:hypothetical protein
MPVVSKITVSGFHFTGIEVDKAILANGISFTIAFSKEVKDLGKNGWTEVGNLFNGKILLVKGRSQHMRHSNSMAKSFYTSAIDINMIINPSYIIRIISTQNFEEPGLIMFYVTILDSLR